MTILAYLVAIGILITVHEFGHYIVARASGVKVLRFSIGFGRPICSFNCKETEWVICMVPLGGYIKMLDEREASVKKEELHRAFNTQSVYKKMAIVVAGPLSNLLFAIFLSWGLLIFGVPRILPFVGDVAQQTPASSAGFAYGDKIKSINGFNVKNWQDINLILVDSNANLIKFDIDTHDGKSIFRNVDLNHFYDEKQDILTSDRLGIFPQHFLPIISKVAKDSPADKAGLKSGDEVVKIDGVKLKNWESFAVLVMENPGKLITLDVIRQSKPIIIKVRPKNIGTAEHLIGQIGVEPTLDKQWNEKLKFTQKLTFVEAGVNSVANVWHVSALSLKFIGRMLLGTASTNNLAGPVTIARIAGDSARMGMIPYLELLVIISISLGVFNLLPIPVLDGGHLMYYVVELCIGRPISLRAQIVGQKIGLAVLAIIMMLALFNDFSHLFGG